MPSGFEDGSFKDTGLVIPGPSISIGKISLAFVPLVSYGGEDHIQGSTQVFTGPRLEGSSESGGRERATVVIVVQDGHVFTFWPRLGSQNR